MHLCAAFTLTVSYPRKLPRHFLTPKTAILLLKETQIKNKLYESFKAKKITRSLRQHAGKILSEIRKWQSERLKKVKSDLTEQINKPSTLGQKNLRLNLQ